MLPACSFPMFFTNVHHGYSYNTSCHLGFMLMEAGFASIFK